MRQDSNIRQQERKQSKERREVARGGGDKVSGGQEEVKPEEFLEPEEQISRFFGRAPAADRYRSITHLTLSRCSVRNCTGCLPIILK